MIELYSSLSGGGHPNHKMIYICIFSIGKNQAFVPLAFFDSGSSSGESKLSDGPVI